MKKTKHKTTAWPPEAQETPRRVRVIFRTWKPTEHNAPTVIALFPDLPADTLGQYVTSYEHVGQHGAASYGACIEMTRPAKPYEYEPLMKELESIGYVLTLATRRGKR